MSLRPLTEADLPLILSWRNAPEVRHNMYSKHEITEEEHRAWFSRMQSDPQSLWFIHTDPENIPNGVVYFTKYDSMNKSAFWGFYTAPESSAGTGTKLGLKAIDKAFFEMKIHKLNAEVIASNDVSARLHTKLGFQKEGLFRDYYFDGENYCDVVRLGLLSTEWEAKRNEIQTRIAALDSIKPGGGGYSILIFSDKDSWINPYLDDLIEEWDAAGHEVKISHDICETQPADFCFCLSFGQIVPDSVRALYKHTLVVHESDLPQGRGWAPMTWQILEGRNRIAVTLIEAVDGVDEGQIYLQEWIDLNGTETNPEWRALQARATHQLCRQWVSNYPSVLKFSRTQTGETTYYPRRRPNDSKLDTDKTLSEQFNLIRVVDNDRYPAYFEIKGRQFTIKVF